MFGLQWHLRCHAGGSRYLDEDRQTGDPARAGERCAHLRKRLPDGGPSNRERFAKCVAADASLDAAGNGLWPRHETLKKLSRAALMSLAQYASQRTRVRSERIAPKQVRTVAVRPNMTWCVE